MKHNTLHELVSVQFASINNLYSKKALSYKGALLQVNKDINKYLKAGLVKQIPFDLKPRNKRQQYFYCVTREGAKVIDRPEEYKQKITKSINNAEHESMKIDIALSFIRCFPDWEFEFDYHSDLGKLRPDILVKGKHINSNREFTCLVEIERKKEFTRIIRDKISRYDKFISSGLFTKNKLSPLTRVLFVCLNLRFDPYLRPLQYKENKFKPQIAILYKQFNYFINQLKCSDRYYRFIPFTEFDKLDQPIFRTSKGYKVNLIS